MTPPLARLLSWIGALAVCLSALASASPASAPAATVPICRIQGYYFSSPYLGQTVTTTGVVHLDLDSTARRGFYMQTDGCDASASSSNGVFVYLAERLDVVSAGDLVQVTGVVEEYYGRTELNAPAAQVQVISHANPAPIAAELNPPFNDSDARVYFERLEGMAVRLGSGRVVGPTDADARTWLVRADLGVERVFDDDPDGAGEVICADDTGLYAIEPAAAVGDRIDGLAGALDYRVGVYCLDLGAPPELYPVALAPIPNGLGWQGLSLATFNLGNLFDAQDDPLTADEVLSAPEYQRRLYKRAWTIHDPLGEPSFLALQEVENAAVLAALARDPDLLRADYQGVLVDGPDGRGLDVAVFYRPDHVWPLEYTARQGCTTLVDGLGPDGNGDPVNPANALTCDRDGDGQVDGNRLFSRPPLAVRLRLEFPPPQGAPRREIWVIVNHWKSKVEDTPTQLYTRPRRTEQARFVADLADELRARYPAMEILVMGDLNDQASSPPLQELLGRGFQDISARIARPSRYTYNYRGVSQSLDYILWLPAGGMGLQAVSAIHLNADSPSVWASDLSHYRRSSDHDPLLARFFLPGCWLHLPFSVR